MSNSAEHKPGHSDPLLIIIAALLLVAVVATLYFSVTRPGHAVVAEPAPRPRPIITNDTRVVVVTREVAKPGAAPAAEVPAEAVAAKPPEAAPEKPAEPAAVEVAAPVVKPTTDGRIFGRVILKGTPPAERPISPVKADKNCGPLTPGPAPTTRNYVAAADGGLRYVLVRVVKAPEGAGKAADSILIDQVACMYEPYVSATLAGQPFKVKNSDAFMHNVNATPKVNKGFNFAQAAKDQVNEKTFDKAELAVKFACNVHPWMIAYLHVLENPFYAVTGADGSFELPAGLPAGKYTLEFNHLKVGVVPVEVELAAGAGAEVTVEMGVK